VEVESISFSSSCKFDSYPGPYPYGVGAFFTDALVVESLVIMTLLQQHSYISRNVPGYELAICKETSGSHAEVVLVY
jgi:hypothetical protein